MNTFSFAAMAGMGMFAMLVMAVVGALVGALVLSLAFRLVVGHMPSYLRALAAVILTWLAVAVTLFVLGLVLSGGPGRLLGAVVMFLVGAAIINRVLPTGTGLPIGYGQACLVQLAYMLAGVVLALVVGMAMALIFGSMQGGLR
ncbi:MAG: hypothetical protein ABIU96_10660 [Rhodanobacter sp.]